MKIFFISFVFFTLILHVSAQTKSIVYFDSNKSELKPDALKVLDSLASSSSNYIISTINGYCDYTGNDASNQILSENRAHAVANYLKKKNFSFPPIIIKGFGKTFPIANNDSEEGKTRNRRVEIIAIKIVAQPVKQATVIVPTQEEKKAIENKGTFNEKSTFADLEVGKTLVLKNINFEAGTDIFLPEAKPTLEMLLKILKNNPTLIIEIGGHVCCKGGNMSLSIDRARRVFNYLLKNGISQDRMTYKGYGRDKPIYEDDDTNKEHARANRRVEVTVLKK